MAHSPRHLYFFVSRRVSPYRHVILLYRSLA